MRIVRIGFAIAALALGISAANAGPACEAAGFVAGAGNAIDSAARSRSPAAFAAAAARFTDLRTISLFALGKYRNQLPKAMHRQDMDMVLAEFQSSTKMAAAAGFDMIELHAAHGYLISSFISPKSNHRTDEYGGTLENRMRYPLEVLRAMRAVWGEDKPMSVRLSAHDWVGGDGVTPEDAVMISRMFADSGADIIDVSAGQTSIDAKPVYGRMFQTPFSDRIRNEANLATMAVGNIYEMDHVNSILMAGRADLVCLARPHLADPYWTLHAAVQLGDEATRWPLPYLPGRDQARRLNQRAQEVIRA